MIVFHLKARCAFFKNVPFISLNLGTFISLNFRCGWRHQLVTNLMFMNGSSHKFPTNQLNLLNGAELVCYRSIAANIRPILAQCYPNVLLMEKYLNILLYTLHEVVLLDNNVCRNVMAFRDKRHVDTQISLLTRAIASTQITFVYGHTKSLVDQSFCDLDTLATLLALCVGSWWIPKGQHSNALVFSLLLACWTNQFITNYLKCLNVHVQSL